VDGFATRDYRIVCEIEYVVLVLVVHVLHRGQAAQ